MLPLGLSAGMPVADAAFQEKTYGSGTATLIISNEEVEDTIKIVKSLEESGLLLKKISETIKNEAKEQKGKAVFSVILGTLAASIFGNVLTGRGVIRADEDTIRGGKNA